MGLASPPPVRNGFTPRAAVPKTKAVRRASALDPFGPRD
jgi:hypothetical protein